LSSGTAFLPFIISVVLLGGATGLIKANIAPLMGQQYVHEDYVATVDGERVVIERESTVQKIMAAYYLSINVGAFVAVGSTFAEKYVGFWLAYLIPGVIFFLMPPLLYFVCPYLAPEPAPSPAALLDAYDLVRRAAKGDPPTAAEYELASDDEGGHIVEPKGGDVKQALLACKLFLFFAIYNIADGGLNTIMTSMAGSMTTNGVPNDFLEKANPFAIVLAIPLLNKFVYPLLEERKIPHGPVRRVVAGFVLAAAGMLWCALLQYAVYLTSPCGFDATTCEDGVSPLSAWLILPAPLLTGASEAIACVSALELAFTMSPPGLRSIVTSLFLFTQAISAILILAFLPLMHDPLLVWTFLLAVGRRPSPQLTTGHPHAHRGRRRVAHVQVPGRRARVTVKCIP
jgi:dipeptide/tripeptide permease